MKKKILFINIIIFVILICNITSVQAGLQANPNTQYKKKDSMQNWMSNTRKMETAGGVLGLTETIKPDLTSNTSNNIDMHMMRSTEYGAIAILSASAYGNPSNSNNLTTTSGNNTGMIMVTGTDNTEFVASGYYSGQYSGINVRYYDVYKDNLSAKSGDAMGAANSTNPGCQNWHGSNKNEFPSSMYAYLKRNYWGIFGFTSSDNANNRAYSRGVVVCGVGF